jgi:hypothetical protein
VSWTRVEREEEVDGGRVFRFLAVRGYEVSASQDFSEAA